MYLQNKFQLPTPGFNIESPTCRFDHKHQCSLSGLISQNDDCLLGVSALVATATANATRCMAALQYGMTFPRHPACYNWPASWLSCCFEAEDGCWDPCNTQEEEEWSTEFTLKHHQQARCVWMLKVSCEECLSLWTKSILRFNLLETLWNQLKIPWQSKHQFWRWTRIHQKAWSSRCVPCYQRFDQMMLPSYEVHKWCEVLDDWSISQIYDDDSYVFAIRYIAEHAVVSKLLSVSQCKDQKLLSSNARLWNFSAISHWLIWSTTSKLSIYVWHIWSGICSRFNHRFLSKRLLLCWI